MAHVVVPSSWHNVTDGQTRFDLPAATLDGLLRGFARAFPEAAYRLYSPTGELLRYHLFFVDGESVYRTVPADEVRLRPESRVEIIPPLSGG
jgi:ThiS family